MASLLLLVEILADSMDSFARRFTVLSCIANILNTWILLAPSAQAQLDQSAEVASLLCAYPIYLSMSIVATELMVTVGIVWWRLRRAFFYLGLLLYIAIAYYSGCYLSFLFIETTGGFSSLGVLGKAAMVIASVGIFAPMCQNILVCFLAVFLGY